MSSPDSLLRATLNRLAARLSHGLADAAVGLAALAQDAPERLSDEWDLFQKEVIAEADRLEQEIEQAEEVKASSSVQASGSSSWAFASPCLETRATASGMTRKTCCANPGPNGSL